MMDVDGGSISLDKIISMEYTNMCMKIADAACIQVHKFMCLSNKVIQFHSIHVTPCRHTTMMHHKAQIIRVLKMLCFY